jgi:hypothetical protein
MGEQTTEKTVTLILIILVVAVVLLILAKPKIIEFFQQMPGYTGDKDTSIDVTPDDYAKLGMCISGDKVGELKNNELYVPNKEGTATGIIIKEGTVSLRTFGPDKKIGSLVGGQIKLDNNYLPPVGAYFSVLKPEQQLAISKISGAYSSGTAICSKLIGFKCADMSTNYIDATAKQKYLTSQLITSFETYSKEPPKDLTGGAFKSILISIVQQKNWISSDGDIQKISVEMKSAFDSTIPKYDPCKSFTTEEQKFMCILSIYNSGVDYHQSGIFETKPTEATRGQEYAQSVKENYRQWQYYFCEGINVKPTPEVIQGVWNNLRNNVGNSLSKILTKAFQSGSVGVSFNFLKNKGFTNEQASGIIGNLIQESNGLDPYAIGDSGTSIGLAQWHLERKTAVLKKCPGTSHRSIKPSVIQEVILCQLDFLYSELQSSENKALIDLQKQTTVNGATISFMKKFERCKTAYCNEAERIANAQAVFDKMTNPKGTNAFIRTVNEIKEFFSIPYKLKSETRDTPKIAYIILHHTGDSSYKQTYATLLKRGLSVHYILDRDGKVYSVVDESRLAYHAAGMNSVSIGIEIVNTGNKNMLYTEQQYDSLNKLLKGITMRWNIPYDNEHIIGHFQTKQGKIDGKWDPSPNFEWAKIGLPNHATPVLSSIDKSFGYA